MPICPPCHIHASSAEPCRSPLTYASISSSASNCCCVKPECSLLMILSRKNARNRPQDTLFLRRLPIAVEACTRTQAISYCPRRQVTSSQRHKCVQKNAVEADRTFSTHVGWCAYAGGLRSAEFTSWWKLRSMYRTVSSAAYTHRASESCRSTARQLGDRLCR